MNPAQDLILEIASQKLENSDPLLDVEIRLLFQENWPDRQLRFLKELRTRRNLTEKEQTTLRNILDLQRDCYPMLKTYRTSPDDAALPGY